MRGIMATSRVVQKLQRHRVGADELLGPAAAAKEPVIWCSPSFLRRGSLYFPAAAPARRHAPKYCRQYLMVWPLRQPPLSAVSYP